MSQPGMYRPLRTLAPRMTSSAESHGPASPAEEGKTRRASTACKECKKRRTKCSTGNPCTECAAHNRECIYDEAADKRRKAFTKQTQEQLRYYQELWERLLNLIRYSERDRLHQLIGEIRGSTSNEEVEAIVNRNSPGMEEALGEEMEEGSEAMSGVMEDIP